MKVGSATGFLFLPALEVAADHVHLFVKHEPKASTSCEANQFKGFTTQVREELPHLRSRMPTLWSSSFFNTQWERPWTKRQKEEEGGSAPGV